MAQIKLIHLTFQRNGVHGQPFYHALIDYREGEKYRMLVTFETDKTDKRVNWQTCRAVNLDNLNDKWRGDEIAINLTRFFANKRKKEKGCIYDYCTQSDLYAV